MSTAKLILFKLILASWIAWAMPAALHALGRAIATAAHAVGVAAEWMVIGLEMTANGLRFLRFLDGMP